MFCLQDLASEGVEEQIFRREAPESGAEGAVLENSIDFQENCFFIKRNKSKNLDIFGLNFFPEIFFPDFFLLENVIRSKYRNI